MIDARTGSEVIAMGGHSQVQIHEQTPEQGRCPRRGDELAIVVVWHSAVCPVIALRGELGAATLADLVREVGRVLAERPASVAVDLTRLASCGFEGMGALIGTHRRARQLGGELVLAGAGTDVAIEACDITLVSGALSGVVTAVRLSRATMRNIRQNLFLAFAYNAVGIPIAAGVLYPFLGLQLSPSSPPPRWLPPCCRSSATPTGCAASPRRSCTPRCGSRPVHPSPSRAGSEPEQAASRRSTPLRFSSGNVHHIHEAASSLPYPQGPSL
ncbi:STAS domain-containing protein [Nonomuraea angiospora]|uniref:STAS domain-containing protein n=1 Tax=Nonomuraea angiospora TaxID=46172 RepID=UPI003EBEDF7D